jgi:hypothetical protein
MYSEEVKGFIILTGIFAVMAFTLTGCMERKLKGVSRVIEQVEYDSKYVN